MKKILIFTLITTCFLTVFSCKNTEKRHEIEVNFLINDSELQSLGMDYNEDDLSLYKNDPDKVYFTEVGKLVEFKDISISKTAVKRKWYLDNEEWGKPGLDVITLPAFTHIFDTPGLYRIKLVLDNEEMVSKLVRVVEKSGDLVRNSNGITNEKTFESDLGDFEIFDFTISDTSPEKWEPIVLEDISKTKTEITNRLWDFGDGTIIPTKGAKVKYSYAQSGVYEVKMCVNLTNNCKRKRIIIREVSKDNLASNVLKPSTNQEKKNKALVQANTSSKKNSESGNASGAQNKVSEDFSISKKIKTVPSNSEELIVQNVDFELPEKIQAGLPVRFKDLAYPDEAIKSRTWFIDDNKQYFHQRTINYIFDSPGTYDIKMCINNKLDLCVSKKINVYQNKVVVLEKPIDEMPKKIEVGESKLISYIPINSKPSRGFMCELYGKAGLQAKYKCTENKSFYYGNAIVNLKTNIDMELQNAEIYGETDGYIDVLLLDENFAEIGRIINVQVLPGYSTIEFADLSFTLKKNKNYSLLLKPKPNGRRKIGLENAESCNVPTYFNEDLQIEYQGKALVIYDLKYCK